jgi:long-chain acyl-CoA synthetase
MDAHNLVEMFRGRCQQLGPRIALRFKNHGLYHDLSWSAYGEAALACASALVDAGIQPGDRVGILAENRLEWLIADLGILAAGAVNVPPHAPLTARQVQFQLQETGCRWLFVSNPVQFEKIQQIKGELVDLVEIVMFDRVVSAGARSWEGFLQQGRSVLEHTRAELAAREKQLGPDDLATIMYTSGTTGQPKGVMLTHNNLLSNVAAMNLLVPSEADTVLLNWLPLSHIYARTVDHYLSILAGATLCLAESSETVLQNWGETQPTRLSSVPRLYEKVLAAVSGPDIAASQRRLRGMFGPRLDFLNSGGAPLPPGIAHSYRDAGLLIFQGYGLTETSPVISFNHKKSYKLDTVGRPLPGVDVKIAADGEVLTRGPHVMKGYWKNPAATGDAIRDGWFYTGDLGRLDDDGFLIITGRKKELLIMSSGKKVVPSHIEGLLCSDPCIDQAVVHGEGKNFLTALIVPNWTNLRAALSAAGVAATANADSLAHNPAVYRFLEERISHGLAEVSPWENVKKFAILTNPFTVAAEELTVSLKLRREVVLRHNRELLEQLYG